MHNPFRKPGSGRDSRATAARWDDRVLGLLMIVLGAPRVVIALVLREHFGAEASLAAIMTSLGLLILASRNHD